MTGHEVDLRVPQGEGHHSPWMLTYEEVRPGFGLAVFSNQLIMRGDVLLLGDPGYTLALEVLAITKWRPSEETFVGVDMYFLAVEQVREGPQVPQEWVAPPQTHAPALVAQDARGPVEQGHPAANFCWV